MGITRHGEQERVERRGGFTESLIVRFPAPGQDALCSRATAKMAFSIKVVP